jgi:hypothetical protein
MFVLSTIAIVCHSWILPAPCNATIYSKIEIQLCRFYVDNGLRNAFVNRKIALPYGDEMLGRAFDEQVETNQEPSEIEDVSRVSGFA